MTDQQTYTLQEAQVEMRRRECASGGHSPSVDRYPGSGSVWGEDLSDIQ